MLRPGDVLEVRGGTYRERLTSPSTRAGSSSPAMTSRLDLVSAAASPTIRHGHDDPAAGATALARERITRLRIVGGLCLIDVVDPTGGPSGTRCVGRVA